MQVHGREGSFCAVHIGYRVKREDVKREAHPRGDLLQLTELTGLTCGHVSCYAIKAYISTTE